MNNTEGEYVDIPLHYWMTGGEQGGGDDDCSIVQGQLAFFLGWEAVKGLPFSRYGLQLLSPLLIKLNKATLN